MIQTEFNSERIKLMDSLWTINIFINLHIHAVGDSNKHNGFESQFLVDIEATCSLINFDFLQELKSLIGIKLIESKQKTIAVNGERLNLLGYIHVPISFDIEGKYYRDLKTLVSEKNGCELNILGMDFLNFATKSIEFTTLKLNLKKYPNVSITLSKYQTRSYPFVSKFEKVVLNKPFELAPKSSRVLTIIPSNHFFKQGTSFIIDNRLQDKGIYTYNVHCVRKEKELPIMLNNPGDRKVTIDKSSIGYTLEICQKTQEYTLIDNVAFLDLLTEIETDFNHIFHVNEKVENPIKTLENPKLDKTDIRQKLKKVQKKIQEKVFADHHKLETDFSQDLKDLKPKATIEGEIRPQQISLEKLEMFSKSDREFLKKFDFSQSDINDAQLLDLMKLLARDKDVYSQHKYDVGKIKQKFHVKLLPNSTLTKQRPS